jgi:frataxin-like iron-binding protein CyaY
MSYLVYFHGIAEGNISLFTHSLTHLLIHIMIRIISSPRCLNLSLSLRSFTTTTVPLSRKKKSASSNSNAQKLVYDFDKESKSMLLEIEQAITPMKKLNPEFEFLKLAGEFQVNTGPNGWFIFKINRSEKALYMASPISGPFEYKYCPESKNWLSSLDKHDMRGMIVRDMLRKFVGFPKF